jgi:hypothetical protein
MGWGVHGYRFAMHNADFGYWCAASSVLTLGLLSMLDLSYWTSKCMKTLRAILVVLALFAFVFGIFNAAEYPASPLVVTMLALPFYLMSFKVRQGEERRTAGAKRRLRGIQRYNKQPFARRFAPRYSKNNIPYRLSSRNSFSSSLRSSPTSVDPILCRLQELRQLALDPPVLYRHHHLDSMDDLDIH